MATNLRTRFSSAVIFFVLIASAVFTVPARADSGSPPPAPSAPGGSTHSAAQVPSGAANSAGAGDQGHKVELSSQNAAYIAPAGDPVWCPASVAVPTPGANHCSPSGVNADLYTLTQAVDGGSFVPLATNSNIWIEQGPEFPGGQVVLNGSHLNVHPVSFFTLTFKGGWTGGGVINPLHPSIINGVGISIYNWQNNVTLSNITVNNASDVGFYVQSNKVISLLNDVAYHGGAFGADLENTGGTGVTITDSSFTQNDQSTDSWGLNVLSGGPITLTGVIVDQDYLAGGAYLDNSSVPNKPVVIKSSYFDNNQIYAPAGSQYGYGLSVLSQGAITLTNVSASGNYNAPFATGALLDNTLSTTAAPVTLTGTNVFDSNAGDGLDVTSNGKITSASIIASKNGGIGVFFNNQTAASAQPVTLTGNSTFNLNGSYGLNVESKGAVLTNGLTALSNLTYGVAITNPGPGSTAPVTLNGVNTFNFNLLAGLFVISHGAVLANSLTAISNTAGAGALIDNSGASFAAPVTLKGLSTFNNNGVYGLHVISKGAVLTNGLTALSNTGFGVEILNAGASSTAPVTLKGLNTFNHNGPYGLYVISKGAVLTNGLTALSNNGFGVYVDDSASSASPVTLNGVNTFNFNHSDGLHVLSKGAVTANSLTAISNTGDGAYIDNSGASFTAPVTLKGLGTFNYNGPSGLFLMSKGAVLSSGLTAISNIASGATIINDAPGSTAPLTLNGLNTFNSNGSYGLYLMSNGAVVANQLTATSNTGIGAYIVNDVSGLTTPVTLKGLGTFNINGLYGLYLMSRGAVLTGGLTALSNTGYGAYIGNADPSSTAPVTLNGVNTFNFNGMDGLHVLSNGAVVANSLTALSNVGGSGAYIINSGASFNAPVTLKGLGTFNYNSSFGLYLISRGAVLTGALTAISNSGIGAYITNTGASSAAPLTLKGFGTFNSNGTFGLYLVSNGAVLTNGLNAFSNNNGVHIDNSFSSANAPLTLNGVNTFNNNRVDGLYLVSKGTITTNNLTASDNGSEGVFIDNSMLGAAGAVNIKGKNIFWNNLLGAGLDITSLGPVTVTNISSKWNGLDGLIVNTPGSVSVSCGSFISNGTGHVTGYGWETGLSVPSITLIGVTSVGNFTADSKKDNAGTIVTVVKHSCSLP